MATVDGVAPHGGRCCVLVAYAVPIIDPTQPQWVLTLCRVTTWGAWALFSLDYVVRLLAAERRVEFIRQNVFDLLVILLPMLRPLRLLRLVVLLRVVNRKASTGLRGRVAAYVVGGSALLGVVGALAVLDAERRSPDANIKTFGDAMWWAITTMTTVGYGDRFPTTPTGRWAAAGLMLGGIALLGVVTATFASWLVERVSEESEATSELAYEVVALREQISRLTQALAERHEVEARGSTDHAGTPWASLGYRLPAGAGLQRLGSEPTSEPTRPQDGPSRLSRPAPDPTGATRNRTFPGLRPHPTTRPPEPTLRPTRSARVGGWGQRSQAVPSRSRSRLL